MGYRSRLGKVKKEEKKRFYDKTYEQAEAMIERHYALYRPEFHNQLIELGNYFELTKSNTPFYSFDIKKETECEFFIMTKEQLKELIYDYHDLIYQNYERIAQGKDDWKRFISSRARVWCSKYLNPYYLDDKKTDGEIASSWQYEYQIFNLVYIYRTFDWENDYLIYSAW